MTRHVRLQSIQIHGFGVFGNTDEPLSLDRPGLILVTGENLDTTAAKSNGAGKSTIFKALSWALFGRTIDGLTTNVVHKGFGQASVRLKFAIDGVEYAVTRDRTKSKGSLSLIRDLGGDDEEDLTQAKTAATQASVTELIGVDFAGFRMCCMFGQGDTSRFASPGMTDAGRKAVLNSILNLERYVAARDYARSVQNGLSAKVHSVNETIADIEHVIADNERSASRLKGELDVHLDSKTAGSWKVAELKAFVAELETSAGELQAKFDDANSDIDAIKEELRDVSSLRAKADDLRRPTFAAYAKVFDLVERLREAADGAICASCGQSLPTDADTLAKAEGELEATLEAKIKASARFDKFSDERRELEAELREASNESSGLRSKIAGLDGQIKGTSREESALSAALASVDEDIATLRDEIKAFDDENEKLRDEIGVWVSRATNLEIEVQIAKWWVSKGFSAKGVPAYAIEQVLPSLNAGTNEHLAILADGDIEVVWTATTPGAGGKEKEELTCNVTVEGVAGAIPSGGQFRKIELATELALAEIVGESGVSTFNALFFDEALDGLDEPGRRRVVEWLQGLPYATIFVVSHTDEIADAFEREVRVVKSGGAATIH